LDFRPLILSFEFSGAAIVLAGVIGTALAALLAFKRFPGRDVVDVIVTAPMVMPPTVLGYYVLVALGRRSPIGQAWEAITGSSIVFTGTGATIAATIVALPLVAKSARAALEGVDATLVSAARTLGASPVRAFFTIQLPLAAPGIVAGLVLGFARSLGEFGVTLMVAGNLPGETQTASLAIYDAIQAGRDHDALALVLILSALAIVALYGVTKLTAVKQDE
jgi:molybdate transport system permease protein